MSIRSFRKRAFKSVTAFIIVFALVAFLVPSDKAMAADELMTAYPVTVIADGGETAVRAFDGNYENNTYLSLTDLSVALKGTPKQFTISYDQKTETFSIVTGKATSASAGNTGTGSMWLTVQRWPLNIDGKERRYYTMKYGSELYMSLTDIMLVFDVSAGYTAENRIEFYTSESFTPDLKELDANGYFDVFNGVLLGDADTGRVIFAHNRYQPVPIASTTKLMTWLLLAEAVERGEKSFSDRARISAKVARLSDTPDSQILIKENSEIPVSELVDCMMLASSNECALAVAEYVAGSEEAFVELMNARAKEMRLSSAKFYNCHGLPSYAESTAVTKRQNVMSVSDMFKLSRFILGRYPEITDTTSKKTGTMDTLKYASYNSNSTLFNVDGVNGLKTGSTNKAGSCVVVSMPFDCGGETHTAVAIVMGAETAQERGQAAEILLKYAAVYFGEKY